MPNVPPLPPDFLSPWGAPMRNWMQAAEQSLANAPAQVAQIATAFIADGGDREALVSAIPSA